MVRSESWVVEININADEPSEQAINGDVDVDMFDQLGVDTRERSVERDTFQSNN